METAQQMLTCGDLSPNLANLAGAIKGMVCFAATVILGNAGSSRLFDNFSNQIPQKYVWRYVCHPAPPQFLPRIDAKTASYF